MIFVIDANSLLALVRYHVYFDSNDILREKVESLFGEGNIVLLDTIKTEVERTAKGIVVEKLPFLGKMRAEKNIVMVSDKMHRKIDNNWCYVREKDKLEGAEYNAQKEGMLRKGDFQLILYALEKKLEGVEVTVVTEESQQTNDGKVFRKIPLICKSERIECITLPKMLERLGLKVSYGWGWCCARRIAPPSPPPTAVWGIAPYHSERPSCLCANNPLEGADIRHIAYSNPMRRLPSAMKKSP